MTTVKILEVATTGSGVEGTPYVMDGSYKTIHIQATSYGTNGKIVLKESPDVDGAVFVTMRDANTVSGLAEYSANNSFVLDRLPIGWRIRADIEISSGTATAVLVVMGG